MVVAVNYAPNQSQCYLHLPFGDLARHAVLFEDLMSQDGFEREGNDLATRGLYLDLPPWGFHVFRCTVLAPGVRYASADGPPVER
jgi:hypothetical protein